MSTVEDEYVIAESCCAQIIWIKQQLAGFGLVVDKVLIKCDKTSAINISKNLIQHLHTKHIDTKHHLLESIFKKAMFSLNSSTLKNNWLTSSLNH